MFLRRPRNASRERIVCVYVYLCVSKFCVSVCLACACVLCVYHMCMFFCVMCVACVCVCLSCVCMCVFVFVSVLYVKLYCDSLWLGKKINTKQSKRFVSHGVIWYRVSPGPKSLLLLLSVYNCCCARKQTDVYRTMPCVGNYRGVFVWLRHALFPPVVVV